MIEALGVLIICILYLARADFEFQDFNTSHEMAHLHLNGNANVTLCDSERYNETTVVSQVVSGDFISREMTVPGDRIKNCSTALRLTKSRPNQVGSAWYIAKQPIADGFETYFSFRFSNQSKTCREQTEADSLNTLHYRTCSDDAEQYFGDHVRGTQRGGDGLAFVVHHNGARFNAIGEAGRELGYGGIRNSLAVEFDTLSNQATGDPYWEHINVHSNAYGDNSVTDTKLAPDFPYDFGNTIHHVRIRYEPGLNMTMFHQKKMVGSKFLSKFLHSQLGTFCVFIDDLNDPKFCIPIDLGSSMSLDAGQGFVGFTAATGDKYQNHDLYKWKFCRRLCFDGWTPYAGP